MVVWVGNGGVRARSLHHGGMRGARVFNPHQSMDGGGAGLGRCAGWKPIPRGKGSRRSSTATHDRCCAMSAKHDA